MLEDDTREKVWRDYTATALYIIQKGLFQDHNQFPSYMDMVYPDKVDKRSAEQIKADLIKALG
jgi:hypothetical protein